METITEQQTSRHQEVLITHARALAPEMAFVAIVHTQQPEVGNDEAWQLRALCKQSTADAFYPEKGGSVREAKKICGRCDVRAQCLEFALVNNEQFGVWGGLTQRERRRLRP
jgi:WhiB family redox-sensing transcriptional regulator